MPRKDTTTDADSVLNGYNGKRGEVMGQDKCPFCGQLISDEFNFCPYCAAKIDKVKVGGRYGRLVVVRKTSQKPRYGSGPVYECECDCGNIALVESKFLMNGNTTSCGCRLAEINSGANVYLASTHTINHTKCDEAIVSMFEGKLYKNNTSGVMGVSYCTRRRLWRASISFQGKRYNNEFKNKQDAIKWRKNKEYEFWGELR